MSEREEDIDVEEEAGGEELHHGHHRRHHKHRIRVKQKIKVKKSNSRVKKKAKKIMNYFIWSFLIIVFILSIILLITELDKIGVTKDRRNKKSEILLKEKDLSISPAIKS